MPAVPPGPIRPAIAAVRRGLRAGAHRWPRFRSGLQTAVRELTNALDDDTYGGAYFGQSRDPYDRMGLSGYERYDRDTSNANSAAYLIWRNFDVRSSLDVGCATGFVVEALRELGVDAKGTDVSQYAVDHAALGARGHLRFGDLLHRLPFGDGEVELITCLETLEHLPPESIDKALTELRRVTSRYLVATIPTFGANRNGPGGWFDVKVRPERLDHYRSLGPSYEGPVPHEDLYRDARGEPIEGHLTIASFDWWTKRFEDAGFIRCDAVERRMHPQLARLGMTKYWNLYVMRTPSAPEPGADLRTPAELAEVEERFGLTGRQPADDDREAVQNTIGWPETG